MDIQQSPLYIQYIQLLNWTVITVDDIHILIKKIPLLGGLAKIQRCQTLPALNKLIPLLKTHNIRTVAIEPASNVHQEVFTAYCKELKKYFKLNASPFLPTKTILVDIQSKEDEIFQRFTETKRRAVRRAQKNIIVIKESNDINDLIDIKNKSAGLFGFITTYGLQALWKIFAPSHAAILLASHLESFRKASPCIMQGEALCNSKTVGGILLLFYGKTAHYWIAGATQEGKKLFAPTLLVWEALKRSKKRGCKQFDFVGAWDERLSTQNLEWKGFTKFKEGFGGTAQYYPIINSLVRR